MCDSLDFRVNLPLDVANAALIWGFNQQLFYKTFIEEKVHVKKSL